MKISTLCRCIAACAICFLQTLPVEAKNLLEGCLTDDETAMDNVAAFHEVWQCLDSGEPVAPGMHANSVFSMIHASDNVLYFRYCNAPRNVPGDRSNGFEAEMPVMILDFPTSSYPYDHKDLCFSYPVTVTEPGTYRLSGSAVCLSSNNLAAQPKSFVNTAQMMVFVADTQPCAKTMEVRQDGDTNYLAVCNAEGKELPCAYTPMPSFDPSKTTQPFDLSIRLDRDTRYISIYGPMQQILVGNLSLEPVNTPAGVDITASPEFEDGSDPKTEEKIFTLQGREVSRTQAGEFPGIYIVFDGRTAQKQRF